MSLTRMYEPVALGPNSSARAEIYLVGADGVRVVGEHIPTGNTIEGSRYAVATGATGRWTKDLEPTTEISPAGTKWARVLTGASVQDKSPRFFTVPVSAVEANVNDNETDPPEDVPQTNLEAYRFRYNREHVVIPPDWENGTWMRKRDQGAGVVLGVDVWGDSIGSQGLGTTNRRTLGFPGRLETALQAAFGDGGSGYLSHEYSVANTGTFTGEVAFGGGGVRTSGAASLRWENIKGTTIKIYFRNEQTFTGSLVGTQRWRIDGGSWRNITTPWLFGVDAACDVVTGLADTTHTVEWEWVSGTVVVCGIYAERPGGINIRRFGMNGRAFADYSNSVVQNGRAVTTNGSATVTGTWFYPGMVNKFLSGSGIPQSARITAVAADGLSLTLSRAATASGTITAALHHRDPYGAGVPGFTTNFSPFLNDPGCGMPILVITCLGANDGIGAAGFPHLMPDGMSRVFNPYLSGTANADTPSTLVVQEHRGNWFDTFSIWPYITNQLQNTARGLGAVLTDAWGIGRRSHEYAQQQVPSWFADDIHASDEGVRVMYSEPVLSALLMDAA